MAIKKYKSKSKSRTSSKSKSGSKSKSLYKKSKSKMMKKYKTKKRMHSKSKSLYKHRGGYNSCNLATVKESGFSVDALGAIAGLSIPSSRAAIFRPNCKTDTYQAMTP